MKRLGSFTELLTSSGSPVQLVLPDGLPAMKIVEQPKSNPAWVSSAPDVATHFLPVDRYKSLGLIAHNHLAGARFAAFRGYHTIDVRYDNDNFIRCFVWYKRTYQATRPWSPYSSFVCASGRIYTYAQLFEEIYAKPNRLILQTCVAKNGVSSWGRLFLVCRPLRPDPRPENVL